MRKARDERKCLLPAGAHLMVQNGAEVYSGDIAAVLDLGNPMFAAADRLTAKLSSRILKLAGGMEWQR